jgi:hypothetical protein
VLAERAVGRRDPVSLSLYGFRYRVPEQWMAAARRRFRARDDRLDHGPATLAATAF